MTGETITARYELAARQRFVDWFQRSRTSLKGPFTDVAKREVRELADETVKGNISTVEEVLSLIGEHPDWITNMPIYIRERQNGIWNIRHILVYHLIEHLQEHLNEYAFDMIIEGTPHIKRLQEKP